MPENCATCLLLNPKLMTSNLFTAIFFQVSGRLTPEPDDIYSLSFLLKFQDIDS